MFSRRPASSSAMLLGPISPSTTPTEQISKGQYPWIECYLQKGGVWWGFSFSAYVIHSETIGSFKESRCIIIFPTTRSETLIVAAMFHESTLTSQISRHFQQFLVKKYLRNFQNIFRDLFRILDNKCELFKNYLTDISKTPTSSFLSPPALC